MSTRKWEYMTAYEKLELAGDVLKLVEARFPPDQYEGQAEALVIALQAITTVANARRLFGLAD